MPEPPAGKEGARMTAEIIDFPADAAARRPGRKWSEADRNELPIILILPVVRIEWDDPPLLGRRQTRRYRRAIDKLRDPIR